MFDPQTDYTDDTANATVETDFDINKYHRKSHFSLPSEQVEKPVSQ